MPGIKPGASHMQSVRSTTELDPHVALIPSVILAGLYRMVSRNLKNALLEMPEIEHMRTVRSTTELHPHVIMMPSVIVMGCTTWRSAAWKILSWRCRGIEPRASHMQSVRSLLTSVSLFTALAEYTADSRLTQPFVGAPLNTVYTTPTRLPMLSLRSSSFIPFNKVHTVCIYLLGCITSQPLAPQN